MPDARALGQAYLAGLQAADLEAIVGLFTPDGVVDSPLYGRMPATDFYAALFADTSQSELTMLGVLDGTTPDGAPLIALWFHFDWTLKSGEPAPFDAVDVLELDAAGKIISLHIIYDTARVCAAFRRSASGAAASDRP
jgi:hypothetical protein